MGHIKTGETYIINGEKVLPVDILPGRYCNYDCILCPYDGPLNKQDERAIHNNVDGLLQEMRKLITDIQPDMIWLKSQGEAMLSNCFDPAVDLIKRHGIKIRLESNGYLLNHKDYIKTLNRIDEINAELENVSEEDFIREKRPMADYSLKSLVDNLTEFKAQYPGKLSIDVAILRGINDSDAAVKKLAEFLKKIKPDAIYVYRSDRKSLREKYYITADRLAEISRFLEEALEEVKLQIIVKEQDKLPELAE